MPLVSTHILSVEMNEREDAIQLGWQASNVRPKSVDRYKKRNEKKNEMKCNK